MNVKYSKNLKQAFIAGAPELRKLTELLQDRIGEVKIYADCADDFTREFETVEDLIRYENPKSREICRVHLDAESDDPLKSANIILPYFSRDGISVEFTASEDAVFNLRDDTVDILLGMRPWYNKLALINHWLAITIVPIIVFVVMLAVDLWLYSFSSKVGITGVTTGLFITTFAILFLGRKLLNCLFPWEVFTIGQGELRFKNKERVQWGVVIGFPVSLVAGLIIWLITL